MVDLSWVLLWRSSYFLLLRIPKLELSFVIKNHFLKDSTPFWTAQKKYGTKDTMHPTQPLWDVFSHDFQNSVACFETVWRIRIFFANMESEMGQSSVIYSWNNVEFTLWRIFILIWNCREIQKICNKIESTATDLARIDPFYSFIDTYNAWIAIRN